MRCKLIQEKSIGEFDATLEMRRNYIRDYKRPEASRFWEVYSDDLQLSFTAQLSEYSEYNYDKTGDSLKVLLSIKLPNSSDENIQKHQRTLVSKVERIISYTYCIFAFQTGSHPDNYGISIQLCKNKYEYVQNLYEFLKTNPDIKFPYELIEDIDKLSYRRVLTEDEIVTYNKIDTFVVEGNDDLAIEYVNSIMNKLDFYDRKNHDYTYYLGNMLYNKEHLESAYRAYHSTTDNILFSDASLRKAIACAKQLCIRKNMSIDDQIKWRSVYMGNYLRLTLDSWGISKQAFDNEIATHFSDPNISRTILNPVPLQESTDDLTLIFDVMTSLVTVIEQQKVTIQRLSQPSNNTTPGYDRHIAAITNERLIEERNDSPSARRNFDKRFGLLIV